MVILALYNLKGGVGKTASAVNLAYLSAKDGYNTLVWDLDPQSAASYYLGVGSLVKNTSKKAITQDLDIENVIQQSPYNNLLVIPADLSARHVDILLSDAKQSQKQIKSLLTPLKKKVDVVILDCPPGLSLLHENIFFAADYILSPNVPTTLSIRAYEMVETFCTNKKFDTSKLLGFFTMVDMRKSLHQDVVATFFKDKTFFNNYIPYLSDIEKMGIHEAPLQVFAPNSYAATCYKDLWNEIKLKCLK